MAVVRKPSKAESIDIPYTKFSIPVPTKSLLAPLVIKSQQYPIEFQIYSSVKWKRSLDLNRNLFPFCS